MEQEQKKIVLHAAAAVVVEEILSSSSSSDEENQIAEISLKLGRRLIVYRIQNYVDSIVENFTKEQFKSNFRMYPETFDFILNLLKPQLIRQINGGNQMIAPKTQLLLTLWRLGTPDSFRSICERFGPSNEYLEEVMNGFENSSGFPRVIGAIDGTHINIPAPKDNHASYVNRKGHHSIQLQAICDHKCRFTHVYTGQVGSVHDQRVFRQSEVESYLGDDLKFPQDCHLVSDLAYKLHENLLTPYRDDGHLTERQLNYNWCHSSARIAIERAFGLLKGRFRSLLTVFAMQRLDLIPMHILACCILHNICLLQNDELIVEEISSAEPNICVDNHTNASITAAAKSKRNLICARLNMRDTNIFVPYTHSYEYLCLAYIEKCIISNHLGNMLKMF
ncbi:putative nuclease HARBI1 [Prorops nasuta]|uniref:putative nuclease HARBI1 n=1 Tax=Prorops nasuta TaxID=863751 RepID=UPI0034CD233D